MLGYHFLNPFDQALSRPPWLCLTSPDYHEVAKLSRAKSNLDNVAYGGCDMPLRQAFESHVEIEPGLPLCQYGKASRLSGIEQLGYP